jgi:hypothetical protein
MSGSARLRHKHFEVSFPAAAEACMDSPNQEAGEITSPWSDRRRPQRGNALRKSIDFRKDVVDLCCVGQDCSARCVSRSGIMATKSARYHTPGHLWRYLIWIDFRIILNDFNSLFDFSNAPSMSAKA